MNFWAIVKLMFKFGPELISFIRLIKSKIEEGVTDAQIKRDMRKITKAFENPNRQEAARELDEIFRIN